MALICLTHLSYYQRRLAGILNRMLDISKELVNSDCAGSSETRIPCLIIILLVLGIVRLMLDLSSKLSLVVHLTSTVYYNTLFSLWYLGVGAYQAKLIEWRREMVLFLSDFAENEGYRSRIEVARLLSCMRVNYLIFELQRSFFKIWNAFSCILPLLLLNFVDLWNVSSSIHFVSILILCLISDEGRRLENQFLNLLFVVSLHSRRGEMVASKEDTLKVHETAMSRHFESVLGKKGQQLSRRYAFCMSLHFVNLATMYFLVLYANASLDVLSGMKLRYDYDD